MAARARTSPASTGTSPRHSAAPTRRSTASVRARRRAETGAGDSRVPAPPAGGRARVMDYTAARSATPAHARGRRGSVLALRQCADPSIARRASGTDAPLRRSHRAPGAAPRARGTHDRRDTAPRSGFDASAALGGGRELHLGTHRTARGARRAPSHRVHRAGASCCPPPAHRGRDDKTARAQHHHRDDTAENGDALLAAMLPAARSSST